VRGVISTFRRTIFGVCACLGAVLACPALVHAELPALPTLPWAVYYGAGASAAAFSPFDLVVLDSANVAPLALLQARGKTVLAYISLGEVGRHRSYFQALQSDGLLLEENPNWPDSFAIDVRAPRWHKRVLEELVPDILGHGFDGLFIDTLDYPIERERRAPEAGVGMRAAAVQLVRSIRQNFPAAKIMLNRAYGIVPEVGDVIDMLLGESVFTHYDFASGNYQLAAPASYQQQVELLNAARRDFPRIRVMTLDYWDPDDLDGLSRIYLEQRKNGFSPYVATIGLDRVIYGPTP
jgi:uncharacterized protein (TIGR01370 family)